MAASAPSAQPGLYRKISNWALRGLYSAGLLVVIGPAIWLKQGHAE